MMRGDGIDRREEPLTPAETAADAKLEAFLGEALASPKADPLPPDFTARVLAARPFAPWEVRRASAWRTPVLVLAGLLVASAGVFALPLLSIGPGSAVALWAWVTLGALSRPLEAAIDLLRLLPQAGRALQEAVPAPLAVGGGALLSLGATALVALRPGRQASGAVRG